MCVLAALFFGLLVGFAVGRVSSGPDYKVLFECEKACRQRAEHDLKCVEKGRAATNSLLAEIRRLLG